MIFFHFFVFLILLIVGCFRAVPCVDDYATLMERVKTLELQNEIEVLKLNEKMTQGRMDKVENDNVELRKSLDAAVGAWIYEKQMTAESTFLATISQYSVSVTPGEPIVWDLAPINPGGHFNIILGMYTAPVHGYYTGQLSRHLQMSKKALINNVFKKYCLSDLTVIKGNIKLVDEVRYANKDLYVGSDIHPSGTATINVELTAGQIVRIENYGSTVIFGTSDEEGEMYSWFTGHLLYTL